METWCTKKLTEMVRIEWLFNFERTDLSTVHPNWMNTRSLKIAQ